MRWRRRQIRSFKKIQLMKIKIKKEDKMKYKFKKEFLISMRKCQSMIEM